MAAGATSAEHPAFREAEGAAKDRLARLLAVRGRRTVDDFHRQLGLVMWDHCGMGRNGPGLSKAKEQVARIREEFWQDVTVTGSPGEFNQVLEHAGRVADFMEFAELVIQDALRRDESCGCHFREEHQTADGEALRNDEHFAHVAAWEFRGVGVEPVLHREPLVFERVSLTQRSYK